jgi:hypothetical protein
MSVAPFTELPCERNVEVLRAGGNQNRQELQIEFYDYIECNMNLAIGPTFICVHRQKTGLRRVFFSVDKRLCLTKVPR